MNFLETLRQYRILDYAIFDLALTFLGMWLASGWLSKTMLKTGWVVPKRSWVIWALPIGIIIHLLTGTMTLMTSQFIDPSGGYFLKIFIAFLLIAGFKGVKRVTEKLD